MLNLEPRSSLELVPSDLEIRRRIAEELNYIKRLCVALSINENHYIPGEYAEEFKSMCNSSLGRLDELANTLTATDKSANSKQINSNLKREGLSGVEGEAKTNLWRRLRETLQRFITGGVSKSAAFAAISEYADFSKTMVESVEHAMSSTIAGKAGGELMDYIRQIFAISAAREQERESSRT